MGRPSTVNETENLWSKQNNSEYLIALTTQTRAHTHTQKKKKKAISCSHLLLPSSNAGVFLVMTMQVAVSVHMLKPNPLVLPPSLPAPFNQQPMKYATNMDHKS